ncbi:hypothetical protein D3C80_1902200 [compost metagenome]
MAQMEVRPDPEVITEEHKNGQPIVQFICGHGVLDHIVKTGRETRVTLNFPLIAFIDNGEVFEEPRSELFGICPVHRLSDSPVFH